MLRASCGQKLNSTSIFNLVMLIETDSQHLHYASNLHCPHFLHSLCLVALSKYWPILCIFRCKHISCYCVTCNVVVTSYTNNHTLPSYCSEGNCRLASSRFFAFNRNYSSLYRAVLPWGLQDRIRPWGSLGRISGMRSVLGLGTSIGDAGKILAKPKDKLVN
jgi:hypothetical protein